MGYEEDGGVYVVRVFVLKHCHLLVNPVQFAFICPHRNVSEAELGNANIMSSVSIRPCHDYEYMVQQAGGYMTVVFTIKDLYNKL